MLFSFVSLNLKTTVGPYKDPLSLSIYIYIYLSLFIYLQGDCWKVTSFEILIIYFLTIIVTRNEIIRILEYGVTF